MPVVSKTRRFLIATVALLLALIFFLTVTGRWLSVVTGPAFIFLRESWALADDPLVKEFRGSVAQVYSDSRSGSSTVELRGSGFNISPGGLIVTNRHLVEDALTVRVSFPGKGTYSAREWILSDQLDLALIIIDADDLPVVSISEKAPVIGDELLVIGNPLQFARIANRGLLAGFRENYGRAIPFLVIEALIYPGSSGSPVFNDQGEVVGVVFATLRSSDPAEVRGLAVAAEELLLFLEEQR